MCTEWNSNLRKEWILECFLSLGGCCTVGQEFTMKTECLEQSFKEDRDKPVLERKQGLMQTKPHSLPFFLAILLLSLDPWAVLNSKYLSCASATRTAQALRSWWKKWRVRAPRVMHFCNGQVGSDWWKPKTKLLSNSVLMTLKGIGLYSLASLTFLQEGSIYGISRG